ncbi:MAG: prepilin peptidase [Candidatus Aminicenantes bacterium]|nr:prepilin peptidase [Candidatus Aminicenantes bacterium]
MEKMIIIILIGMAWGSFLNVVIYRLPIGMSLLNNPPSSCPQCKKHIKPYDNVPILSYLILRGKCRYCGARIPVTYPMVEILTPLIFVLLYLQHDLSLFFFASCLFASGMIALCFIDYYHQVLPDHITLPGFALAFIYSFFRQDISWSQSLLGAAAGAGFLLAVYGVYYLIRKKEGLGMGDITLMLMIGAFLGWKLTFFTLIAASMVGAVVGILIILLQKKDMQHALPFGTFLAPAALIALLWGQKIVDAYLSLFQNGP